MKGAKPTLVPIELESGANLQVVTFNFTQMLFSLFSDKELKQQKKIACNLSDLCQSPPQMGANDIIDSFLHTSSYHSASHWVLGELIPVPRSMANQAK